MSLATQPNKNDLMSMKKKLTSYLFMFFYYLA